MKYFYKYTSIWLASLLLLQVLSLKLNYDDSYLLAPIGISIVFLILSVLLSTIICLFKSKLRNIKSLKILLSFSVFLFFSIIASYKMASDYWNIKIENNSGGNIDLHICHLQGGYNYNISILENKIKHIYVPIRRLINYEISVCIKDVGCAREYTICRGVGGCLRHDSKVSTESLINEAKKLKWKYTCPIQ